MTQKKIVFIKIKDFYSINITDKINKHKILEENIYDV